VYDSVRGSVCSSAQQCGGVSAAVRQCTVVRQCKRQFVAVRVAVCDSAAVCRIARGSVQQCGMVCQSA
jgi:hypothetical protein